MAEDTAAFIVPLHPVPAARKDKTGAMRAKAYRQRKRQGAKIATTAGAEAAPSGILILPEFLSAGGGIAEPSEVSPAVTPPARDFPGNIGPKQANLLTVPPSRHYFAQVLLTTAALTLGAAGVAINGWFARSLGSSDAAGWLFLVVALAADLAALVLPFSAAGLWHSRKRVTALIGWAVWLLTFVFAVTASIGFASTNISDVTLLRASRVTPAVTSAQAALTDAIAARDRECKGGWGKFCREREAAVAERRQVLDSAVTSIRQAADPQAVAASRLVAWGSGGMFRPAPEDVAMLRCQSALDWDPLSASKRDPFERRVRPVALAPSELAGVAETVRARVV